MLTGGPLVANFRTNNSAATHDLVVNLRTTKTIRYATPRLQYNNNSAATLDMEANLHTKKLYDSTSRHVCLSLKLTLCIHNVSLKILFYTFYHFAIKNNL